MKQNINSSGLRSTSTGRRTIRVTAKNYEEIKTAMKRFLILEITRQVGVFGTREKLSLAIGHAENYVQLVLKRQSFSALERLVKECKEKLG